MIVRDCEVLDRQAETPSVQRLVVRYEGPPVAPARFAMLALGEPGREHLLPRPFSFSDVHLDGTGASVADFLFKPVGVVTKRLAGLRPGDSVRVFGPLGVGFPLPRTGRTPWLLAGGIGNAPFPLFLRHLLQGPFRGRANEIRLVLAGRTAADIYIQDWVRASGVEILEVTDDGTRGERGRITEALRRREGELATSEWFACGPEPMLAALGRLAEERNVLCHVAVEAPMACGYGVCNGCVIESRQDHVPRGSSPFRRVCVDGPVFECREVHL